MEKLVQGIHTFQAHIFRARHELFERLTSGQNPQALFITCSDSRVMPDLITQAEPGDLFVLRNAGNLVPPHGAAPDSGEAATIEYAVTALKIRDVIVCGHTLCGAMQALLHPEALADLPRMRQWLSHAEATREIIAANYRDIPEGNRWKAAVEENVLVQLENLRTHPCVAAGLARGALKLHGWVYKLETGQVFAYDPGQGQFLPLGSDSPAAEVGARGRPRLASAAGARAPAGWSAADRGRHSAGPPRTHSPDTPMASQTHPPAGGPGRPAAPRGDLFASLVVFLVALPLCIAIARACGLPAEAGLITGIVGGLVVGPLSGSPLQVSGPAAGLIVLVLDFVLARQALYEAGGSPYSGVAALGVVVFLAGLVQVAMAALRLGQWFRAVSPAVVLGMLAGIGVVIVAKQAHEMIDDRPAASVAENLASIPAAAVKALTDPDPDPPHHTAAVLAGLVTLLVLVGWKRAVPGRLKMVPAALAAVLAGTLVAEGFGLPASRIAVESNLLAAVTWLRPDALLDLATERDIWVAGVAIGVIASAETLLCATAVDQIHRGPRTNYNRELFAQGVGNTICGVLGAPPMTGVIVRSSANVAAGAKTRLSATLHGLWLLLFVALLPGLLARIPSACLAAVLVYTGVKLIDWRAALALWRASRGEAVIFAATLLGVVFADLLTGVLVGVALTAAKLAYVVSHLTATTEPNPGRAEVNVRLEGAATFLSLPKLARALDRVPAGWTVHVYLDRLLFIDHACLHLLTEWEKQHRAGGGQLTLDQDGLRARFGRVRTRAPALGPE